MDYQFENLGPERFQQFCQALLIKEFPNIQCFPIAQPDGGRDAVVQTRVQLEKTTKGFIVFQVKFVRRPQAEADPHNWLTNIVREEAPKVKKLIPEGAEGYYLLTNVPGTAHPNSGSIDKVDKALSNTLKMPFQCWWRDDLNRRLDNLWNLKWVYPELMTGLDMLHYVFESGLSEDRERRITAIRSFIRTQYEADQEVRFKQIELQNKLIDLFIDVPARYSHGKDERKYLGFTYAISRKYAEVKETNNERFYQREFERDYRGSVGAASLLLDPMAPEFIPQIVLEGAPGQGKSTIVQYVCQVYRMHLLQEKADLEAIPQSINPTSIRIPFKVDLRDLATWLNKQDPFSSDESEVPPENWQKSLESFLAFQVKTFSGGFDFSVTDLHAIAKISAFLLVLDGLDEVAEISKRQEIVAVVKTGVNRLKDSCASLQVVITSRPTAFVNSPGFPESTYPHFELTSITKPLINEYANKWIKARKLNSRDSADVRRTLKQKLDQPHLRDLTRNPMQLAIVISLIHDLGPSLPDKRTALYDKYVELFFSRESEKSIIIREYRELLIDIHRYLAWLLHSEAERGSDRGSISSDRLHIRLSEYLAEEGYDPSLAEKLFTGMVERVVALVSRIQGTYEFEVQPLREYFAARFLYETAPYSPPAFERKGTKPDRFDAIAKNFYWLNVARFYAGCFSKGELPSLVDSLEELCKANGYRHINHPRTLAATLLSDWVFTQNQRSMHKVIKLILDGINLRHIMLASNHTQISDSIFTLPKGCGRDELLGQCFIILHNHLAQDYAIEIIDLIKANTHPDEALKLWHKEIMNVPITERTRWLKYGLYLGVLQEVKSNDLDILLSDDPNDSIRLEILLRARQSDFCQRSSARCNAIIRSVLNGDLTLHIRRPKESILSTFCVALNTTIYTQIYQGPENYPFELLLQNDPLRDLSTFNASDFEITDYIFEDTEASNEILKKCIESINVIKKAQHRLIREWKSELSPWNSIVEQLRTLWGDQWILFHLANIASSFHASKETYQDFPDLLDHSKPLCARACYARSKARSSDWWKKQFLTATTESDFMFVSLLFLTWSNSQTLVSLSKLADGVFNSLPSVKWQHIIHSMQVVLQGFRIHAPNSLLSLEINVLPSDISERTIAAIGRRLKQEKAKVMYFERLSKYQGLDATVLEFSQELVLKLTEVNPNYWQQALTVIAKNYAQGFIFDSAIFYKLLRDPTVNSLPLDVAEKITNQPENYPRSLVSVAEAKCRVVVASKIIPVGEIAQQEGWFILNK